MLKHTLPPDHIKVTLHKSPQETHFGFTIDEKYFIDYRDTTIKRQIFIKSVESGGRSFGFLNENDIIRKINYIDIEEYDIGGFDMGRIFFMKMQQCTFSSIFTVDPIILDNEKRKLVYSCKINKKTHTC